MDTPISRDPNDWSDRVGYADGPEGKFAYHPRQLIVRGGPATAAVVALYPDSGIEDDGDGNFLMTLPLGVDVLAVVADLRDDGYRAEANYVLFAHDMEVNSLQGNPLWGNPLWGNAVYGNPLWGNPLWGNPLWGNPVYEQSLYYDQYQMTGIRPSTARPACAPTPTPIPWAGARSSPSIIVLDTGLADANFRPPLLDFLAATAAADQDVPDDQVKDPYGALDPVAGHGTFIAGIIERLMPGRNIAVAKVLQPAGDTSGWVVGNRLMAIAGSGTVDKYTILNLSLGGHAGDFEHGEMWYLARAVRKVQATGAVVVASAGNNASARRSYPACLPGVIGVGGLSSNGPASFTNHGSWVRACAPAVNLVSAFFTNFNGPVSAGLIDPDKFEGWARWTGTSFAAPVVVAALAREMVRTGCTAAEAVAHVIDAPGLLALPGLGTVVNIV